MGAITKHNYEQYFLDYFEGNLQESEMQKLFDFLDENPEFKEEFYDFELVYLPENDMDFPDKNKLPAGEEIDYDIIAFLEGDLDQESAGKIQHKIKHNIVYKSEFQYYKSTKLVAEEMVYEPKDRLKRRASVFLYPYGIAATLLLLLGLAFYLYRISGTTDIIHKLPARRIACISPVNHAPRLSVKKLMIAPIPPQVENAQNIGETIADEESMERYTGKLPHLNVRETSEIPTFALDYSNISLRRSLLSSQQLNAQKNKVNVLQTIAGIGKSYLHKLSHRFVRKNKYLFDMDVANSIVKGYNRLTNNDIQLVRIRDNSEKVIAFYIANDRRRLFRYKKR